MKKYRPAGQAMVEYLLVFALVAFLGLQFVRGLGRIWGGTFSALAVAMTKQLSSGVCPQNCFYANYKDGFVDE
jgi:Flp pilus assembly pilin Flp